MWQPFLHKPTRFNLNQWPDEEASRHKQAGVTATDIVLQKFNDMKLNNVHVDE